MKKTILFLIAGFSLLSCSKDDNEQDFSSCIDNMTVENGFIYECKIYKTEIGIVNMHNPSSSQTMHCSIKFINSEYADFSFEEGDSNINIVQFSISIPAEYYQLKELPEGTYNFRVDDDPSTLDITYLFRVGTNVSVYRTKDGEDLMFSGFVMESLDHLEKYQQVSLTIDKLSNGAYEIEYIFEAQGKIVKGHFKGVPSFIEEWS